MSVRAIRKATNHAFGRDVREELDAEGYAAMMSGTYAVDIIVKMCSLGLGAKDLAERMGISPEDLGRMLRSENMTFEDAASLALALGSEVEAPRLFSLEDPAPDEHPTMEGGTE